MLLAKVPLTGHARDCIKDLTPLDISHKNGIKKSIQLHGLSEVRTY